MKHKNLKLTSFTALGEDVIQVENELREYSVPPPPLGLHA